MPHSLDRRSFLKSASAGLGAGLVVPAVASAAPAIRLQPGRAVRPRARRHHGRQQPRRAADARLPEHARRGRSPRSATWTPAPPPARRRRRRRGRGRHAARRVATSARCSRCPTSTRSSIAAPDHWHAPAAIMALQAGKHVYVEKPCSHNPREGEWLVETQKQTGKVVQMGNQRRSWPNVKKAIELVHGGPHRTRLRRTDLVFANPAVDRQGQARARPRVARLRPLAGSGATPAVRRQRGALRVALALALGHRRIGQQRHPHVRPRALGHAGGAPVARHVGRRALSLRRRLGVPRHADRSRSSTRAAR